MQKCKNSNCTAEGPGACHRQVTRVSVSDVRHADSTDPGWNVSRGYLTFAVFVPKTHNPNLIE